MTTTATLAAQRRMADRLELWRLRGHAARTARQARRVPPFPRSAAGEYVAAATAAWLAGYDRTRQAPLRKDRER